MKDLKSFQSELKQEEKELEKSVKEEVQSVPKVERKSVLRRKLSDYQGQMMERVRVVVMLLTTSGDWRFLLSLCRKLATRTSLEQTLPSWRMLFPRSTRTRRGAWSSSACWPDMT